MTCVLEVREREYTIVGRTVEQLESAMALLGPTRNGSVFPAYTDWSVDWSYRLRTDHGRFAVDSPSVRVEATVTLPSWRGSARCSSSLRTRWVAYRERLRSHEDLHVGTAERLGKSLLEALLTLPARPTRNELTANIERLAREMVRSAHHDDLRHDVEVMPGL